MDILRATPMTFGLLAWPLRPPQMSMVLVVKATFDIVPGGTATLAREQRQPHGPVHHDDDPDQSLRLDSDFALLKPSGECLVAGTCHPPDAPARVSGVAYSVGPVQKWIGVFGDRRWAGSLLGKKASEPEPFMTMPLRWERAFGGPGYGDNPLGRGLSPVERDGEKVHWLPNLEDPRRPVDSPSARPEPVVGAPSDPTWPRRLAKAGTYDREWARARFPFLAADFDPAFYLSSPEDQRLRGRFWTGTEEITLRNLVPGAPFVKTRLPRLRARALLVRKGGGAPEEVPLVLDTLTVDADAGQVCALWRGAAPVADNRFSDVERLFLAHEPVDARRSPQALAEWMQAHLRLRAIEESGFVASTPAEEDEDARTISLERLRSSVSHDPHLARLLERATAARDAGEGLGGATMADIPEPPLVVDAPNPEADPPPEPPDADAALAEAYAALAEQGMAVDALRTSAAEAGPAAMPTAFDEDQVRAAFAKAGVDAPDEIEAVLATVREVESRRSASAPEQPPEEELTARSRFLLTYAEGRAIEGDFTGVDVSGERLAGLVADGAILTGANFTGCDLGEASFVDAHLSTARFDGANLERANLSEADLTGASLRRARLSSVRALRGVLDRADLGEADLRGADLNHAEARQACFEGAMLEDANLDEADLTGARLAGARLARASLSSTRLASVDARGADLSGCKGPGVRAAHGARFDGATLRGLEAEGAQFFGSCLDTANLSLSRLDGADFSGASLQAAQLGGCRLRGARFVGARAEGATIHRADLMSASLLEADLRGADLRGSSFYGAEFYGAQVDGARFALADLTGTKLAGRGLEDPENPGRRS